jgi:hypothetical protein
MYLVSRFHFRIARTVTGLTEILVSLPMIVVDLSELLGINDPSGKLPAFMRRAVVRRTRQSILKRRSL